MCQTKISDNTHTAVIGALEKKKNAWIDKLTGKGKRQQKV